MSYNIEYRPSSFSEVMGNKSTLTSLQSLLSQKKRPHVFLFSGPSGCGKTTLARIVAKELECSENDFIELNSSNNRGIDTAREIISSMGYKPLKGKVKVYLLDEVHQSTKDFQQAMLKALEDCPPHVYFMLCTTEPEKLLTTIRNRATSFHVEKLQDKKIIQLLSRICRKEDIEVSKEILEEIAIESEGSPRQAVIMLQQVGGLSDISEMKEAIKTIKIEQAQVIELCRALIKNESWKNISTIIKGIEEEPEKIRRAVLGYMSAVLLNSGQQRAALIIECFSEPYYNTGKAGLVFSCFSCVS